MKRDVRVPRLIRAVLTLTVAVAGGAVIDACATRESSTAKSIGGSLVISAFADPDILLPPLTMSGQGLQVVDAVFDRLGQPSEAAGADSVLPSLASAWTWSADSLSIDFTINAKAKWHDGRAVMANDVRFTWAAYVDSTLASPNAQGLLNIDSISVSSPQVARVWFKRRNSDQLADAALQMRILPQHLLDSIPRTRWRTADFARHPIGSGRFRFANWQSGTRLEVVADSSNYRGRPNLDRVIWTISPDPAAASMRLFAGDADFLENVRPDAAAEFGQHTDVALLKSPALVYGFVQFNLRRWNNSPHPLFGDRALRRALSMAVDRASAVQSVFDSLARVAVGPVTRAQLGVDSVLPSLGFDAAGAARLLDSLGWKSTQPGATRTRNGVPLKFSVLVPSSSNQRVRLATVMQSQLHALGVQMEVERVEFNLFNTRLSKGDFDAAINVMGIDPSPSAIRGIWSTAADRSKGGVNFGGYQSTSFDALLDSASMQRSRRGAAPYYRRAYAVILDDAPAIWLFEPWNLSGVRRSIHPVGIRPDGWWMQLGDWTRDSAR